MARLCGGRTNYGETVGILMLDTRFPRIPGDVGNASTFRFPVRYRIVRGVRAVTTSCGFLALFQKEIASAVSVPFFSSSLIQAKIASQIIGPDRKVGILTAEAASMGMEWSISRPWG